MAIYYLQMSLLNKLLAFTGELPYDGQHVAIVFSSVAFAGYLSPYCMPLFGEPLTLQLHREGLCMAGLLANKLYCSLSLCHFDDACTKRDISYQTCFYRCFSVSGYVNYSYVAKCYV